MKSFPSDLQIIIPSKGRAGQTKTDLLLQSVGFPYSFLVEPQEVDQYRAIGVPVISLPLNNQGISYARNYVLEYGKGMGFTWVLMLDDDIGSFGRVIDERNRNSDPNELLRAFAIIKRFNPAVGGIEYSQNAWCARHEVTANRFCDVAVFLNLPKITWHYRPEMNLKEDRDFVLQAIKHKAGVIRVNKFYFNCPQVGSNKGGLYLDYKSQRDIQAVRNMMKAWPGVLTLVKKSGRIDFKVNWKALRV